MSHFAEGLSYAPYGYFHFHIYFKNEEERTKALSLSQTLIRFCNGEFNKPAEKPIGPHPFPMVEVDIGKSQSSEEKLCNFVRAVQLTMTSADGLSVLIHPLGRDVDPLSAHTLEALWVGPQLELNLKAFDRHN